MHKMHNQVVLFMPPSLKQTALHNCAKVIRNKCCTMFQQNTMQICIICIAVSTHTALSRWYDRLYGPKQIRQSYLYRTQSKQFEPVDVL